MKINSQELDNYLNYVTGRYDKDQFRQVAEEEAARDKEASVPTCLYCPSKLETEQEQRNGLCKWCQLA